MSNRDALTDVLWAEDGVFPLCVEKADVVRCLVDPFAGYLLVFPRLLAGVVAMFPVPAWALVANLLAALVAGITCGIAYALGRRSQFGERTAVLLGMIPVALPIVGLEALNALGSTYMLLLYLTVLVLALPSPRRWSCPQVAAVGSLLLLSALTIPTTGIALLIIPLQIARRKLEPRTGIVWAGLTGAGLLAQLIVATNATNPREISPGIDSLRSWIDQVPIAISTMWPGLGFSQYVWDAAYVIPVHPFSTVIVTASLSLLGIVYLSRRDSRRSTVGLLIVTGLLVGAVPSVIGVPSNRYFVVPMMLWTAALVILFDPILRRMPIAGFTTVLAFVLFLWWPLFPASHFRATPDPAWHTEVSRVEATCSRDPERIERFVFTPTWPPNADVLSEPTHPDIDCGRVDSWLGVDSAR